jgi:hypothetical protein
VKYTTHPLQESAQRYKIFALAPISSPKSIKSCRWGGSPPSPSSLTRFLINNRLRLAPGMSRQKSGRIVSQMRLLGVLAQQGLVRFSENGSIQEQFIIVLAVDQFILH